MSRNDKLNQFDNLIDELQRSDERPSAPRAFKHKLRGNLLNQYEQSRFAWGNMRQWVGTAVALGVLALIVVFSWSSISQQSGAASAYMGTVDVPGRDEFIVYDQLRLEFPMWVEINPGWAEMTAESWQSLDGTFFRGEVVDANDKQRIFVQGDGQFLWRGTFDSSVERMETVSLHYFDVYHALAQAEGWTGNRTTPPFYDDVGWDGLVQSVLRLDWNCGRAECVTKYLAEPPLGVNSRGGEYEPYGWGVDLVGTQTTANGRSLTTYRIDYSPNQDGVAGSQYRLVKLDSNNHTVVEVADYDGETLLRRLERVSHQVMTSADLPEDQFMLLPPDTGVSYVLPEGRVTAETPLLAAPNGEAEATLPEGTPVTLSGLMNNQLAVVQNGITWQYVTVDGAGQGWVDEANLQWPLTSDGQLVDLDTSGLPTAVPIQTQLTILRTYRTELQAALPKSSDDELALYRQALAEIEAEIDRLEYLGDFDSLGLDDIDVVSWGLDQLTFNFDGELTLTAFNIEEGTNTLNLTLDWLVQERPSADYQLFFHLQNGQDNIVAQIDQPLQDGARSTTAWEAGEQIRTTLTLNLPDELIANRYDLILGLYNVANGVRLPVAVDNPRQSADGGTAVWLTDWFVEHKEPLISSDCPCVWLFSATQHPRTSADDPVTLIIDIAYQLDSDDKVILKPLYAHPDWSTAVDGRLPIDGLGDEIVLDGSKSTFGNETIAFVENPAVMRDIVGTDYPVLVMQLRHLDEDGEPTSAVSMEAMPNFTLDLTSTEEVAYEIDRSGFESVPGAVVSGTDGNGLTLQSEPNGEQIGILEEGSVVLLNDDTLMESEGLLWQSVSTTIGKGWVVADFLEYPEDYTLTDTMPWSPDGLWIVKATQLPRSDPSEPITFEVTVGYKLVSAEEAILSLSSIHPEWETHTSLDEIRYPNYNALGDRFPVQAGTGSVTLTATVEPETITSAIGSDEFGLMPRLWAVDEDGRVIFGPILMGFDKGMAFNVQSVDEITYP